MSALVCTRDRPKLAAAAVFSLLSSRLEQLQVVVVDQTSGTETRDALSFMLADPRLLYLHSDSPGQCRAQNWGLQACRNDVVFITDDDCEVHFDDHSEVLWVFEGHPDLAVAFCNVEAGPHDETAGFVPKFTAPATKYVRGIWNKRLVQGIGAGMIVWKPHIIALGGFDEMLGPGSVFPSAGDRDIAVRALLGGYEVAVTDSLSVVHHGFRTWKEGRALARRDWTGIGAAYVKPLRCRRWDFLPVMVWELLTQLPRQSVYAMSQGRFQLGIVRAHSLVVGLVSGLKAPLDKHFVRFKT